MRPVGPAMGGIEHDVFSAITDWDVCHVDRGSDLDLPSNRFVLEVPCMDLADFYHLSGCIFPIFIRAFLQVSFG